MDAFPAYFPLKDATVAVAGTGDLAEAKARLFEGSPALVRRLTGPDALAMASYAGCALAFIADPDEAFCAAAAVAAREAGVPVNVTDRPALSDFTTPAIIDRGAVVAAVGTGGASPMLAASLRGEIENQLPEGIGRLAAMLHRLQAEVRRARPDLAQRRDFLRGALSGPAAEAALAGRVAEAESLLRATLAAPVGTRVGWIKLISGRGSVDLLTLRALRALAEADVVASDGTGPDILARARRDAPRVAVDAAGLAERAQAGERIVCVTANIAALADALGQLDLVAEILPVGKT
jgi:precorrin-2 dehydrogenase/sirohydrochlorin ferrochelatase